MSPDLNQQHSPAVVASKPMRILVLHQHYWPETAATAQILSDLCEDLGKAGHEVTVICGQPSYRVNQAVPLPGREERHGVHVHRVWSYVPATRSVPKRLVQYGTYFGLSIVEAARARKPDVCLVMSTPPLLLGVAGIMLRALKGVPFVYSVQDLYPDIAVHLGVLRANSLSAQMAELVARTCYRSAAGVIALSQDMAQQLIAHGVKGPQLEVIPNWADTESIQPLPRDNAFARECGLVDNFVVQYSGNLGLSQGLDCVLEAAEQLRNLPVLFAFFGDGNARASLVAKSRQMSLSNVRFFEPQPRERLGELLASCDVGLVPMKKGVGADLVPSKLYGIMAAARPVLASVERESEVGRVVEANHCGVRVEPEDAEALAQGIRAALALPVTARERMGERGRQVCISRYSRTAITRRYEVALRRAAGI